MGDVYDISYAVSTSMMYDAYPYLCGNVANKNERDADRNDVENIQEHDHSTFDHVGVSCIWKLFVKRYKV
jgi:hypothetical protein